MSWITLLTTALSLAKEILKLVAAQKELSKKEKVETMKGLRDSVREGRKKGDLSDVEAKFRALGIAGPK